MKIKLNDEITWILKGCQRSWNRIKKRLNKYWRAYNELIKNSDSNSSQRKRIFYSDAIDLVNRAFKSKILISNDTSKPRPEPDSDNTISVTFIKRKK